MLEEFLASMPLWQKILGYAALLIGLFIFVKTSRIKKRGKPWIPLKWRITIAVFFPLVAMLAVFFGAIILSIAVIGGLALFTYMKVTGKKINIRIVKKAKPVQREEQN